MPQPQQVFLSGPVLSLALSPITQALRFRQIFFFLPLSTHALVETPNWVVKLWRFSPGSVCLSLNPPIMMFPVSRGRRYLAARWRSGCWSQFLQTVSPSLPCYPPQPTVVWRCHTVRVTGMLMSQVSTPWKQQCGLHCSQVIA